MSALRATAPGLPARSRYMASCFSLSTLSTPSVFHFTSSASRPCLAGQKASATTATPLAPRSSGTSITATTPLMDLARLASKLATLAPQTGGREITTVFMPGRITSRPKVCLPVDLAVPLICRVGWPMMV